MKLILRFLILLSVFGFSQRSLAFTAENLKTKENLQETNYQFNELQMNQIICNDSLFVAELSFTAVNPSPWGYIVLVDGMFYSFELFSDSLVQTFVLEINDPSLGSEIFVEVIDGNLIAESNFLLECDAPCSIGEPIITVLDCNDSLGVFSVELDFEYENVESAQFEVHGNATHYGTFQYTDLPIVLEGFEGNGDMVYELIAYDHEDSLCSSGYGFFGPVSCPEVMNDCITFEDFDLGFYTLPDSLSEVYLGTYQSVDLSAHPFSTGNPNFPFVWGGLGIVDSDNNPIGQISGNAVNYENTTVEFDFMHFLGANVLSVSFDYVSLLDGVNFGINSNDYDYLPSYSQISNNIPGLDINVSSTSIGNNEVGSVTILGDISNLIIGGFYGYLDNICFEYLEDIDCELSALNLTVSDCDTSDELNFNFDFDYSGVNEEGFLLVGYNNDYFAQFDYADLPVTINDLGTEVQENYSFGIITLGSPDTCSIDLDFETPACYLDNPCEITSINYSIVDCNPLDSSFYVNVWFDYDNLDSLSVSIFGSGYDWGEFDAWEQPVTLGPYYGDQGVYEVIIQDTYDSECLDVIGVDSPSCLYTDCQLSALEVDVEYCTDSLVFLDASFLAENVNPSVLYEMYLNDESYGLYQYSVTNNEQTFEFAIEDPQFGSLYILEIIDGNDEVCSTAIEFVLEPCSDDCSINALEYEIVDCNPLDSSFYVNVWFDYDNLDSLSVSIFGSGYDWGEFDAWEQPVTLGPYYGDQGVYEVIIQDTYDSECLDVLAVDSPSCLYTDCGIDWIQYEVVDCNPLDTSFYLNIWFDNNSLDSSMVSIFGDGYDWGEFDASEQPVQIGPFIGLESSYEVIIQNTNDPACFKGLAVDSPACFYTDCYLDFSNYNIIECSDTDSTFYLELYFNYDNLEGDAVSIFGGGYDWGIFNPEIQPIVVGPYFSGQTNYEVIVADQLNPNCSSAIDFGPVDCSEDCSINIMEYNIIECSETDSTFYVEVLFEYENLLGDAVSIFGGGYNWGIFNPALQPMLIGPFFTGDLVYEILVADQLDLECYDLVEFEFTGCGVDCNLIEEIWIADGPDCQGDLCEIEIGVDLSQAGANESVDIHLGGFSYYDYPPSQLDGVYFDFQQDSLIESSLIVCISGSFDCCDTLYFDLPSNGSEFVWPGDANSDNIANNIDLLYIGLADGFQGIERSNFGISWEAYESEDWPFSFPESLINFKHADSNGDAVVDLEDIGAIIENYGLTHGVYEPDSVQGGIGDPPLFIDLPSFVEPGETIEADIDLGVISNPVQDLYGIAFTLEFPEDVFVNNNIEFDFTDSWIGEIDQDLYSLQQPIEGVFEIDIALVRNNQENADANYGRIGNFIGVIDDVLGIEQVNVKIKDVHAISNNEILIPLNLPVDTMLISSTDQLLEDIRINVYPIPTNKFLYLDTDIAEEVISMEILNSSGIQVKHYDQFESRLDLKALLNGIYLLRVKTSKGIYQERIMIFN